MRLRFAWFSESARTRTRKRAYDNFGTLTNALSANIRSIDLVQRSTCALQSRFDRLLNYIGATCSAFLHAE